MRHYDILNPILHFKEISNEDGYLFQSYIQISINFA